MAGKAELPLLRGCQGKAIETEQAAAVPHPRLRVKHKPGEKPWAGRARPRPSVRNSHLSAT